MTDAPLGALATSKKAMLGIFVAFVLLTIHIGRFGLFNRPPGSLETLFITDAKPYYFEKSSLEEKAYKFKWSKEARLNLSNVTKVEVAGEAEGTDLDVLEVPYACFVTIDGERIDIRSVGQMNTRQYKLYANAIKQISANVWKGIVDRLVVELVLWAVLLAAFIGCFVYRRKHVACRGRYSAR